MEQENNMQRFLKLIISNSEKKAKESNMTQEQKKELINKRLFEYFEKSGMRIETILPIYKEVYTEFVQEDFIQYVVAHTSNQDIIFEEKLKIEKKLEKISSRIAEINKKLGVDENLSNFDLMFREFQQHESSISVKINQVKKKYELPTDMIKTKSGQNNMSEEQMQEYLDLIAEMVDSSSSVEELYEIAKGQIGFFAGMGDLYEDELRKKSPELFEYIDTLVRNEVGSDMEQEQKLEEEKQELKKLEAEFINMCKKYDTRLPANLRGTEEERKQRERIKKQKEEEEIIKREREEAKRMRREREEEEMIRQIREAEERKKCNSYSGCGSTSSGCGC